MWGFLPIAPNPYQHSALSDFVSGILAGVKWDFIVVLISISLVTNDVGYLFTCVLAIPIFSLVKYLIVLTTFYWVAYLLNYWAARILYSRYMSLIGYMISFFLFYSVACLSTFLMAYFEVQRCWVLMKSSWLMFSFLYVFDVLKIIIK